MGVNSFIAKCSCQHEMQDKLHGKGNRVFNIYSKGGRCTVCGTSKEKPKDAILNSVTLWNSVKKFSLAMLIIVFFCQICFAEDIFSETKINNLHFIENYLFKNNCNSIFDDMLEPPFFYSRSVKAIQIYKKNKADFSYISELRKTPLFTYFDMYSDDDPEIVKEFIKNGVNPYIKDYEGLNAADYALINERKNCLIYLIRINASPTLLVEDLNEFLKRK